MTTMSETADVPYLVSGSLPHNRDEIAVTQSFADKFGISCGDDLSFDLDDDSGITVNDYTVSGVVLNVTDVNTSEGCTSFRSTAPTDYAAYISRKAVDSDIYTGISVILTDSSLFGTYSDEYKQLIQDSSEKLAVLKDQREAARTQQLIDDALNEISEKEKEMYEEFGKTERELKDSKKKTQQRKSTARRNRKTDSLRRSASARGNPES